MKEELGVTGHKRQSWAGDGPRAIIRRLHKEHPTATMEELALIYYDHAVSEDRFTSLIIPPLVHWATLQLDALHRKPRTEEEKAEEKEQIAVMALLLRNRITKKLLLDTKTPSGRKLRDCNGAECLQFGTFYRRIGMTMDPTDLVGDKFKEQQLQDFLLRGPGR